VSEQVLSFALDVSDKVMVIEKGEIVHQESSAEADQKRSQHICPFNNFILQE
jgi:urea transport system ATP-binding protein